MSDNKEYLCCVCDDAFSYGFVCTDEKTNHICEGCSEVLMDAFEICPTCFSEMNDDAECLCSSDGGRSEKKFIGKKYSLEKIRRKFRKYTEE